MVYGDGSQTRDFVFVRDVVDALVRAVDVGRGLLLNVGTGVETSVLELHRLVAAATGTKREPVFAEPRLGELARMSLDSMLASRVLGWRSSTSLAAGVAATVDWFRNVEGGRDARSVAENA